MNKPSLKVYRWQIRKDGQHQMSMWNLKIKTMTEIPLYTLLEWLKSKMLRIASAIMWSNRNFSFIADGTQKNTATTKYGLVVSYRDEHIVLPI